MQVLIYHLQSINWTYKSIYKCLIEKKLDSISWSFYPQIFH